MGASFVEGGGGVGASARARSQLGLQEEISAGVQVAGGGGP